MGSRVQCDIQLQWTEIILGIRGQCTSCGTQVEIQIVAVLIRNMVPARKDDVGVRYDVTKQKTNRIVEGK